MNCQRRILADIGLDARAHLAEGVNNTGHRTPGNRFVTGNRSRKRLCRQNARKHPYRRTGVACVERSTGLRQPMQALAVDSEDPATVLLLELVLDTELAHAA